MEGLIYSASPPTWKSSLLSIVTLSGVFLFALFYVLLVPLFVYYYVWSIYFWSCVLFLVSTVWWHRITRPMNYAYWRSNRVFEAWRSYFGLRIYREEKDLESSKKRVLYTFVPHGLFPFGLILVSGIILQNKDVKIGIASNMFYIPVFGFILRMLGCVEATSEIFKKEGESTIVLIPDGIAGAFYSSRKEEVLYLRSRRGFMREAIKHGFDTIVPVYCFGHTQLYDVYGWRELSRRFKFAFVAFWGRSPVVWLPHARTVSVVFGKPFSLFDSLQSDSDSLVRVCFDYQKVIKELYDKYRNIVPEWDKKKELKIV
jgi:hypothetical protein